MSRFSFPVRPGLALLFATAALGACDKARGLASGRGGQAEAAERPAGPMLDLAAKPPILFQVFGDRDDPRMLPIAALVNGSITAINLDEGGWRRFDGMYTHSPTRVPLYHDGRQAGFVTVRQGMWEKASEPLYTLPSCQLLTPMSAVTIDASAKPGYTVEFLASTAEIKGVAGGPAMARDVADRAAREVAYGVGERSGLVPSSLDSLDFRAVAIHTGATPEPTLVAAFIDPSAGEGGAGEGTARHVFAIADRSGDRYAASFTHAVNGPAKTAMYRRYLDHLDLTGDGVDEIILEGWQYGGDTQLLVLSYRGGKWEEVFRSRGSWCQDVKK